MFSQRIFALLSLMVMSTAFAYFAFAQNATGAVKDASFILTSKSTSVKKNDLLEVVLAISNPSKQNITSFESWVTYDPTKLKGQSVDFGNNPDFDLNLIKADPFFTTEKVVKVSRVASNPTAGKGDMILATIKFQVLSELAPGEQLTFDFYKDTDGTYSKNTANIVVDDVVTSIVDESKLKSLIIPSSGNAGSTIITTQPGSVNTNTNTIVSATNLLQNNSNTNTAIFNSSNKNSNTAGVNVAASPENTTTNGFASLNADLATSTNVNTNSKREEVLTTPASDAKLLTAPQGVTFTTKNNSVIITWTPTAYTSYFRIYYSNQKDEFLRYKDIQSTLGTYTFKNLKNNTTYYFVTSEIDKTGKESLFSKEYEMTTGINETISEDLKSASMKAKSYLLSDSAKQSLARVPKHATSGPSQTILLFAILSIGIAGFYSITKKHI